MLLATSGLWRVAGAGRHVATMARAHKAPAETSAVGSSASLSPVPRRRDSQPSDHRQPQPHSIPCPSYRSPRWCARLGARHGSEPLTGLLKTRRQVEETDVARQERWWTPRAVTKSPPIHVGRRRGWSYRNKQLGRRRRRHDRLVCRHRVGDTGAATTSPRKHSRRWCHSGRHAC